MTDQSIALGEAATGEAERPQSPVAPGNQSYRDILKSSAMVGASAAFNVGIGIVRTTAMAVLLGPAGYGLMGAFVLVTDLARSVAQMGLNASGVRQIADSVASNDTNRVARTVSVLQWTSLVCGFAGAVLVALFSSSIAEMTFGNTDHAGAIALLSLVVFFSALAGGQGAMLQGMRRIADLSKLTVVGGVAGTLVAIPMVYFLGEKGLAPTLVIVAAITLAASWWHCRKYRVVRPSMTTREVICESADLLKLGLAFMASGVLTTGASYAVRTIVLRKAGLESAGIYYAAWTLGGLYIGFVLQALGTDFYPRLVGAVKDNAECNRLVNEQTTVSMLLAVPGVLLTLTLAPFVMSLFYTASFAPAVEVLRWICLGMALRVLTWPIGYIVVAKNRQGLFFAIEASWTIFNVGLTWYCVQIFGVDGAGIAFFVSYIFHGLLVYPIVRKLSGFRWNAVNLKAAFCSLSLVGIVFAGFHMLPPEIAMSLGAVASAVSTYVSLRILVRLVSPQRLPRPIARFLQLGRFAR